MIEAIITDIIEKFGLHRPTGRSGDYTWPCQLELGQNKTLLINPILNGTTITINWVRIHDYAVVMACSAVTLDITSPTCLNDIDSTIQSIIDNCDHLIDFTMFSTFKKRFNVS